MARTSSGPHRFNFQMGEMFKVMYRVQDHSLSLSPAQALFAFAGSLTTSKMKRL